MKLSKKAQYRIHYFKDQKIPTNDPFCPLSVIIEKGPPTVSPKIQGGPDPPLIPPKIIYPPYTPLNRPMAE
jgi:hypothetical protein